MNSCYCDKCSRRWSRQNVPVGELPPSAGDGAFQGVQYDYCDTCGNYKVHLASRAKNAKSVGPEIL